MNAGGPHRILARVAAVALPLATILVVVWPNLAGTTGTGPETFFDVTDPLFGDSSSPQPRVHDDPSPVVVDWPRDRWLRERVRAGHLDFWNPVVGNGAPLAPDPGGVFSPLRLLLYAAPLDPYTAFVLFRVARLFVAALGAYVLARSYGQSRPASGLVGIVFGLSGGMVSQLPFAEVSSVCWLPWICWAQLRVTRRSTSSAPVPLALSVAAAATGGHQPIAAGVIVGAAVHALGVIAGQTGARAKLEAAGRVSAGYLLGLLLAAPALLPFAELLKNGHTYKSSLGEDFREAFLRLNRMWLLPAMALPQSLDRLRPVAGTAFPYILDFSCGVLAYFLAAIAVVRRRWRLEWVLLISFGVIVCFGPPGFHWIGKVPLLKDIVPRYMWALVVLPLAVAAGFGTDALTAGRRSRSATVGAALVAFAAVLAGVLVLTQNHYPALTASLMATVKAAPQPWRETVVPGVVALATVVGAALLARHRSPASGGWLLLAVAALEVALIATPHLREPPSRKIRNPPAVETDALAQEIAAAHTRVGGSANLIVGWRGWREIKSVTPLAPVRYAKFIQAAAGSIQWTGFNLPANRSAFADIAALSTLVVPRTEGPLLEGDPQVTLISNLGGVSIFRNAGAVARARLVHVTRPVAGTDEAVADLASLAGAVPHAAETPLGASVILERSEDDPAAPPPRQLQGGPSTPVRFIVDEPDHIELESRGAEPGYLVLADTHYPGWRATVDGAPRPIYPANVGFRAVFVDPGPHRIVFRFRPPSLMLGFALAACATALCLILGRTVVLTILRRFKYR